MVSAAQWAVLEPLVEACRPRSKVPPSNLRRTVRAILWRHENGAKWRSLPAALGPWWMAAQTSIRWALLGVWERLLALVRSVELRSGSRSSTARACAHQKAGAAAQKGSLKRNGTYAKRLAALVAALEPKPT